MKQLILTLSTVFVFILNAAAQDRTITGKVTNDKSVPVEGASVSSSDGKYGTQTDKEGNFSLKVPASVRSLNFSYVNFETMTRSIARTTELTISLKPTDGRMEEVVVVGYGTQQKKKATGSLSKIQTDEFKNLVTPSIDRQLAGRASGVQVTVGGGLVNAPARVRIRGVNSVSLGRDPLYVVDGVPIITGNNAAVTNSNALGDINSNDIESLEVLKDGSATAIYGSRAANGVVIITTKRGRSGKTRMNYDVSFGFSNPFKKFDLLNAQEFVTIANEKLNNAGGANQAFMRPDGASTDWQDMIFVNNAFVQNHTLSFTGGNDKTVFYTSINYSDQDGVIRSNFNRRYGMKFNIETQINKYIKFGNSMLIARQEDGDQQNGGNALSGAVAAALRDLPNVVPYNTAHATGYNILPGGNALARDANTRTIENNYVNIAFVLDKNKFNSDKYRVLTTPYLEFSPTNWLKFRTQASADLQLIYDFLSYDPRHGDGFGSNGLVQNTYTQNEIFVWQNYLNANKTFGRHTIGLTAGTEIQRNRTKSIIAQGTNVSDLFFQQENVVSNSFAVQASGGNYVETGFRSYFGRLNYDYDNRYFIQFSLRRDGVSAFDPANRYGNFPGGSVGWRLGQEKFWQNSGLRKLFSDAKIRGSYAVVGNVPANSFFYLTTYGPAPYASTGGIAINAVGTPGLKWETNKKYDVGIDLVSGNGRVTFTADWFRNTNDNLIFFVPVANSYGVPTSGRYLNIGASKNEGVELSLNWNIVQSRSFKWDANANFTSIQNRITKLDKGADVPVPGPNNGTFNVLREGQPVNALYGYEWAGVNSGNGNPMWYKADGSLIQLNIADNNYYTASKDDPGLGTQTTLSTTDRKILGNVTPTWFGAFTNSFEYKKFGLEVMFRYSGGNKIYNLTRQETLLSQGFVNNGREVLDRWTHAGQVTDVPKLWYGRDVQVNLTGRANSRFIESGDYLRLQNIVLTYNFDNKMLEEKTHGLIKTCRFFVQGQNLWTWAKYKGPDPDNISELGIDNNTSPTIRTISFGMNIGL